MAIHTRCSEMVLRHQRQREKSIHAVGHKRVLPVYFKTPIDFAIKNDVEIEDHEADIIRHSRKAFLFSKGTNDETITWQKSTGEFDVTMGAPDGAEVCELVGIFILNEVVQAFPRLDFGLYRDDGLAVHGRIPKRELELTQQKIRGLFQHHGLEVIFENPHNTKVVNFT